MIFIIAIFVISGVSVILSWYSLKNELKKREPEKEVKEDLSKGRVIFYDKNAQSIVQKEEEATHSPS